MPALLIDVVAILVDAILFNDKHGLAQSQYLVEVVGVELIKAQPLPMHWACGHINSSKIGLRRVGGLGALDYHHRTVLCSIQQVMLLILQPYGSLRFLLVDQETALWPSESQQN